MNDIEVILHSLNKEREYLHQQLMQIDRIIKRVKCGTFSNESAPITPQISQPAIVAKAAISLTNTDNLKIQLLRVMDVIGKGCKLKTIHEEYNKQTGNKYPIRDALRALQEAGLVRLAKEKENTRGFMWVKREWVENGRLKNEHKPHGYDMLYREEDIIFV